MSVHLILSFAALFAYTAMTLYVGIVKAYDKEVASSSRGYFIGGGTGYFVLFFSTAASWFSTWIYMGAPGSFYNNGIGWIAGMTWQLLIMFLMGYFGPKLWRMAKSYNYITPAELLEGYYGSSGLRKTFSLGQLVFIFPHMMAQISGVGLAVTTLTDGYIPAWLGCFYVAAVIGLYVFFGGFKSQAWVETMQGIMFVIILWLTVTIMIVQNGGGISGLFTGLEKAGNHLLLYVTDDGYWNWKMYFSFFMIQSIGGYFTPYVWQRAYAAKNGKTVRKIASTLGFFYAFAVMLPVMLVGFGGVALGVESVNADSIMVTTMNQYAPYVSILVVVGILAAGMSTISSQLVCAASLVSIDFIQPLKPNISPANMQKVSRITVLVTLLVALLLVMAGFSGVVLLVNIALAGFMQVFWAIFGVFIWKRATKQGAAVGFIAGVICIVLLTATGTNFLGFSPGLWGFVVNGILFFVVSLLTKPVSESHRTDFLSPLVKHSDFK